MFSNKKANNRGYCWQKNSQNIFPRKRLRFWSRKQVNDKCKNKKNQDQTNNIMHSIIFLSKNFSKNAKI